ncbi:MAG TPA: J domain-containing protein [Hyphomicrobiaceae bacterium]|nr:J domain-containing protein [Hyphomicrobiaceae bacterium]
MLSFYEALGVAPGADERQIKEAYRSLARRLHPDLNAGDAAGAGQLAEINRAYATLANPEARAAYDRDLAQRRDELRRRLVIIAASGLLSFAVTAAVVAAVLRRDTPPAAGVAAARAGGTAAGLPQSRVPGRPLPDNGPAAALDPARATIWRTYRDARFDFALRYPAGLLAFDAARSDAHVSTFVSRDGQAVLRIVAAENTAGITPGGYRSVLMKDRYAGAKFKPAARREHWFALSGTLGDEVFLERVTFSCDGRSMHGWQMRYPASQRATYDELAGLILRNHPHGNGPGPGCDEERGQPKTRRRS